VMESVSGKLGRVETPLPLIDLGRVKANAQRVADYCAGHGIAWRPHVKTHKSLQIASVQLAAGAAGLTVATPREAEVMATICDDILLAYPPLGPSKLDRLMALDAEVNLTVGLDSRRALDELGAAAASSGRQVGVLVEIDVGLGRMGVTTPGEAAVLAAHAAAMEGLEYRGIMFYPGHIRTPSLEQDEALSALGTRLSEVIETLERGGLAPSIVSGGSSPTLWRSHEIPGTTEIRAGTIIYNDRDMLTLGVCAPEHLAYAVVGTVVSTAVPGQGVLDTGSKALAKESFRSTGGGFGFVLEHPEVLVRSLSEEHGVLDLSRTDWTPAVGDQVRVIPNHVCVSVNLQDRYLVDTGSGLEAWPIQARGRTPWRLEPADD
jgi:D-serine deaminase-like pyridoxal phosphate-dependent protein